ncbi:transposable element Tcb1 transposase [Trichonephila clavipes]|nr:transposable element Tcb1 transposase [Trichonephila clavipes]
MCCIPSGESHATRVCSDSPETLELGWKVLMHPPYSPNRAPNDYHLLLALQIFHSDKISGSRKDYENRLLQFFAREYDGLTWLIASTQCTTSREDRQIMRIAVKDRSVLSRTVTQHIESVTHHSVSMRIIRRRLQQSGLSARRPFLGLPLTQNHKRLLRQWCDEIRM